MGGQEFLNWQVEVDRFFEVMGVPKNIQVKMAGMRLKSVASMWWDKLVIQRQGERKVPIRSWSFPEEYELIPYKKYVEYVQGKKTVMEYTNECVKQELPKSDTKKEDIIVAKETDQGTKQDIQLGTTEYQIPSGPGTKSILCTIAVEAIIEPELVAASSMTISSDSALRLASVEELISSPNSVNQESKKPSMIGSLLKSVQGMLNRAKDATVQKAVQAKDYAAEKAREGADYTANKAREAKDTTMQKGGECKDYAAEKAKQGANFTTDRAKQAKDTKLEKA
ncbi:hypothetical protein QQ045_012034 [Rhodiola kirilowii]